MTCNWTIALVFLLFSLRITFSDVTTPHLCKDDGKCFTVILDQQLTWEKAEEYCENNIPGGRLASVHNAFDTNLISSWLPFLSSNPWIGAFRIGSLPFSWTDGTAFNNQYTNWMPGQPTNRCGQICRSTTSAGNACQQGKWTTADCESQSQFLCEYGNWTEPGTPTCPDQWTYFPPTQACYRIFKNAIDFDDAEHTCHNNGADLASIHSDAENKFIGDLVTENSEREYPNVAFIGMQDYKHTRQWSWSDDTTVNYYHWLPGQPDNSGGIEFCVHLYYEIDSSQNYYWNDIRCDIQTPTFVCKCAPVSN